MNSVVHKNADNTINVSMLPSHNHRSFDPLGLELRYIKRSYPVSPEKRKKEIDTILLPRLCFPVIKPQKLSVETGPVCRGYQQGRLQQWYRCLLQHLE